MKANELRIGNIVFDTYYKRKEQTVIDTSDFSYIERNGINTYEPIPLTEEWLLKFGFDKPENSTWCLFNDIELDLQKGIRYFIFGNKKEVCIKHVHQLQNLYFALTGEELIIK